MEEGEKGWKKLWKRSQRRKRNLPLEMFRFEIQMTNSWRLLEG